MEKKRSCCFWGRFPFSAHHLVGSRENMIISCDDIRFADSTAGRHQCELRLQPFSMSRASDSWMVCGTARRFWHLHPLPPCSMCGSDTCQHGILRQGLAKSALLACVTATHQARRQRMQRMQVPQASGSDTCQHGTLSQGLARSSLLACVTATHRARRQRMQRMQVPQASGSDTYHPRVRYA